MKLADIPDPRAWGLTIGGDNVLRAADVSLHEVARTHRTPVHVVDAGRLAASARDWAEAVRQSYEGPSSVHYAMKCNGVPGILRILKDSGLRIEVMSLVELNTARAIGYAGAEIIVNGPAKTDEFLAECLRERVRFIVIDSSDELERLDRLVRSMEFACDVLLRVNPDIVPSGLNAGSATGSRRGCAFGLDLKGGEIRKAFDQLRRTDRIRLGGFHAHIGTGIRSPLEYRPVVRILADLHHESRRSGFHPSVIDVGGGFASPTSREFTTLEMLGYQAFGRLPGPGSISASPAEFVRTIAETVTGCFRGIPLPELIFEPGRSVTGPNQLLLLTVLGVKERPGVGRWIITDGGLGTVTMPTYYEYHEIFACHEPMRSRDKRVTILGPGCFAGDIVYRNKRMPSLANGDVIALMDTGAYFTALESNFGHGRPGIVAVHRGSVRTLRWREAYSDTVGRDLEVSRTHEVLS